MNKINNLRPSAAQKQIQQAAQSEAGQAAKSASPNGPAPDGPGELHTVVAGDTLWGIAAENLGAGNRWPELAKLNPQIADPNKIWPGDQVRLPPSTKKLSETELLDKTAQADNPDQVQNFSHKNEQAQVVAKKKTGTLSLLQTLKKTAPSDDSKSHKADAAKQAKPAVATGTTTGAKEAPDASVLSAIDTLKKSPLPISGEAMQALIRDGAGDFDGQAAGTEFRQLKRFVGNNKSKLSPEAKSVWNVYEKTAQTAQKKGLEGIPDRQWQKMLGKMDQVKTAEVSGPEAKQPQMDVSSEFNWGDVPVDARSPELQQALMAMQGQAQKIADNPLVQDMMQQQQAMAMQAAGYPSGLRPETAALAQGMGMQPPLSFEDVLFLLQMQYAANKERDVMNQMNALAQGGGAQNSAQSAGARSGGASQGGVSQGGVSQVSPALAAQQAQQTQALAQQQGAQTMSPELQAQLAAQQAQGQQSLAQGSASLPAASQAQIQQSMANLQQAIAAFEGQGSQGGEMITLNEMQQLIQISQSLPPELQQAVKAQAYQSAITEGGLSPEAFQALMGYVNAETGGASAQSPVGNTAATGPGMAAQQAAYNPMAAPGKAAEQAAYNPANDVVGLHKAMRGFGTDEEAIYRILQDKTPAQRQAIMTSYKALYQRDLATELRSELSFGEEDKALKLLFG